MCWVGSFLNGDGGWAGADDVDVGGVGGAEGVVGGVERGMISANHLRARARERNHAGLAYSDPVRARGNLVIVTGASVQRIAFEGAREGGLAVAGSAVMSKTARGERSRCGGK